MNPRNVGINKTVLRVCHSEAEAVRVCKRLIGAGQWFEFTPLPDYDADGRYEIITKEENRLILMLN